MRRLEWVRTPEKCGGRERLTVRSPIVESALASDQIDGDNLAETRRFGNALLASVNRWRAGRDCNSLPERRLSKSDAARLLRLRMAELNGGAE